MYTFSFRLIKRIIWKPDSIAGKKFLPGNRIIIYSAILLNIAVNNSSAIPPGAIEGNYNYSGLPLLLLTNPSLLCSQNGLPFGAQFSYDQASNSFITKSAVLVPLENNAFSFGYSHYPDIFKNRITAGFSHVESPVALGSSFTFAFDSTDIQFTLDAAVSALLAENRTVSFGIRSLIGSDTIQKVIPSSLFLASAGPIPGIGKNMSYDLVFEYIVPSYEFNRARVNGSIWFRSALFERSPAYIAAGYSLEQNDKEAKQEFSQYAGIDLGTKVKFGPVSIGLSGGYRLGIFDMTNSFSAGIYLNPLENRDLNPPSITMRIAPDTMKEGAYFVLGCDDGPKGSGIRQWTLIIADNPSSNAHIIRTYSGGNIPPTSIYWDSRDSHGELYEPRDLYALFVVVDMMDNVAKSEWIPLFKSVK